MKIERRKVTLCTRNVWGDLVDGDELDMYEEIRIVIGHYKTRWFKKWGQS